MPTDLKKYFSTQSKVGIQINIERGQVPNFFISISFVFEIASFETDFVVFTKSHCDSGYDTHFFNAIIYNFVCIAQTIGHISVVLVVGQTLKQGEIVGLAEMGIEFEGQSRSRVGIEPQVSVVIYFGGLDHQGRSHIGVFQ